MLFCLLCWSGFFWSEYALLVGRAGGARVCCGWVSEAGVALVACLGLGVCWRCGCGGVGGLPLCGGHASSLWTSGGRCGGCRAAGVCWGLWCFGGRLSGVGAVTAVLLLSCRGFCQCAWSVASCSTLSSPNRVGFTRRGVGAACACVPLGVGGAAGWVRWRNREGRRRLVRAVCRRRIREGRRLLVRDVCRRRIREGRRRYVCVVMSTPSRKTDEGQMSE